MTKFITRRGFDPTPGPAADGVGGSGPYHDGVYGGGPVKDIPFGPVMAYPTSGP